MTGRITFRRGAPSQFRSMFTRQIGDKRARQGPLSGIQGWRGGDRCAPPRAQGYPVILDRSRFRRDLAFSEASLALIRDIFDDLICFAIFLKSEAGRSLGNDCARVYQVSRARTCGSGRLGRVFVENLRQGVEIEDPRTGSREDQGHWLICVPAASRECH
jgi:hypothetical protein